MRGRFRKPSWWGKGKFEPNSQQEDQGATSSGVNPKWSEETFFQEDGVGKILRVFESIEKRFQN